MVKVVMRLVCLGVFALLLSIPAMAQNTKGDKPSNSRETRFKKTSKREKPAKRVSSKRRTTSSLRAYKPRKKSRGGERAGQSVGPINRSRPGREGSQNVYPQRIYVNNQSNSSRNTEKRSAKRAPKRVVTRSATGSTRNVYPQSGRYVRTRGPIERRSVSTQGQFTRPRSVSDRKRVYRRSINAWARFPRPKEKKEKAYSGDITGRRIRTKNFETKRPPVVNAPATARRRPSGSDPRKSARNRYVSGSATAPRIGQKPVSNKTTLARLRSLQSRQDPGSRKKPRIVPRSASGSFMKRRSTNVWAHFPRPKKKSERAVTTDIAGKPLRTKNYRSPRQGFIPASPRSARGGDKQYKGPASGSYRSASRSGRGWQGDVARRRLIDKNSSSDRGFLGKARPGGFQTATRPGETRPGRYPVPVRTPKSGLGIGSFKGNIRAGRRGFNNQGEGFTGMIRARRAAKGGGSVSGKVWNNNNQPNPVRPPGAGFGRVNYAGNMRAGRKGFADQGEGYSGNIKARRAAKGGGSVSGKVWNNNNSAIAVRVPADGSTAPGGIGKNRTTKRGFQNQGEEYTGNIKARRPAKGGGSVSGKLWNNNESAIAVRAPADGSMAPGGIGKMRVTKRGFQNQGEEYTGNIKARKPAKGGGSVSGKLWNNNETPIAVRIPKSSQGEEFAGNLKMRRGYVKNPNAAEGALKKNREKTTYLADGLQIRVKQHPYGKKPNAAEGSMPGWKPSKESIRASEFTKVVKAYKYVHNKSSADDALKVREPGKAFARATDFQGNIKMKKFDIFGRQGLHPDAQFVKINKNNVAGEKDAMTNFKLWWARLFKKNDTQPDHLKDKGHKPRYDKGEQGLWYD